MPSPLLAKLLSAAAKTPRWVSPTLQTAAGAAGGYEVGEQEIKHLEGAGIPVGEVGRDGMLLSNIGLGASLGNPAMRRSVYGHWIDHNGQRVFTGYDPKKFLTGVSAKAVLPGGILLADRGIGVLGSVGTAADNIATASDNVKNTAANIQGAVQNVAGNVAMASSDIPRASKNLVDASSHANAASKSVETTANSAQSTLDSFKGIGDAVTSTSKNLNDLVQMGNRYLPQAQLAGGAGAGALAGYGLADAILPVSDPRDSKALTRHHRLSALATLLGAGAGAYGTRVMQQKGASLNPHFSHYTAALQKRAEQGPAPVHHGSGHEKPSLLKRILRGAVIGGAVGAGGGAGLGAVAGGQAMSGLAEDDIAQAHPTSIDRWLNADNIKLERDQAKGLGQWGGGISGAIGGGLLGAGIGAVVNPILT